MKVVLSRKCMDSQYGGIPSPVLQTESGYVFCPLPIPYGLSNLSYADLCFFENFSALDFIQDVKPNYKQAVTCHLDPDLHGPHLRNRHPDWQPAFGQISAAQTHLERNGIGAGDVFLFFGWYRFAERKGRKFSYVKSAEYPNGFHVIYGYLQVGKIYKPNVDDVPEWLRYHPHVVYKNEGPFRSRTNTIYTATETFTSNSRSSGKRGAGLFQFHPDLILTKPSQPHRTLWELPETFHPENGVTLTYNGRDKWRRESGKALVKSASQGQEFVFAADPKGAVAEWCANLIERFGRQV